MTVTPLVLLAVAVLVLVLVLGIVVVVVVRRRRQGTRPPHDVLARLEAHGVWLDDLQTRLAAEREGLTAIEAEVRRRMIDADVAAQTGQVPRRRKTDRLRPPAPLHDEGTALP